MNYETKFSVGDIVFVMMEDEIHQRKVKSIHIIDNNGTNPFIQYEVEVADWDGTVKIAEAKVFRFVNQLVLSKVSNIEFPFEPKSE